jgi:uncharacterized protein YjbI with pentapeptide repeats
MTRHSSGTRFPITRVLLAVLGVSGALTVSMAVSPLPAHAAHPFPIPHDYLLPNHYYCRASQIPFTTNCIIDKCHFVRNPTEDNHTNCPRVRFLPGENLSNMDLRYANLSGASLESREKNQTELFYANLSHANLSGANLEGDRYEQTDLTAANLTEADLTGAELSGANFNHANLTRAKVSSCRPGRSTNSDRNRCDSASVDLAYAELTGAHLNGANLPDANLIAAHLYGADLRGANLLGAFTNGGPEQFYKVTFGDTTCPDGTNSNSHEGTCANDLHRS